MLPPNDMNTNGTYFFVSQVEMIYWLWMYLWAAPLQVVITMVLLYIQV